MSESEAKMRKGQAPETIGGHRVIKELGRGSMGVVYLAEQKALKRPIAIKVLLCEEVEEDEFLERFRREGQIAAKLRHPNIVQVFEFGEEEGILYIAMEYAGSRNLKDVILQAGGKLSAPVALKYTYQLLGALSHAHSLGVVHRDIKPANVLISDDDEQALLTDFSIAHMAGSSARLTLTGVAIGTPEYMAPEQLDSKHVDSRADLYATGIILYQMLTGISPFAAESIFQTLKMQVLHKATPPHLLEGSIGERLSAAIMKSLEKLPQNRWSSAKDMLESLSSLPDSRVKETTTVAAAPFEHGELKLRTLAPPAGRPGAAFDLHLGPDAPRLIRGTPTPPPVEKDEPNSEVQWGPTWGSLTPPGLAPIKKRVNPLVVLIIGALAILFTGMAIQRFRGSGGATPTASPSSTRQKL